MYRSAGINHMIYKFRMCVPGGNHEANTTGVLLAKCIACNIRMIILAGPCAQGMLDIFERNILAGLVSKVC